MIYVRFDLTVVRHTLGTSRAHTLVSHAQCSWFMHTLRHIFCLFCRYSCSLSIVRANTYANALEWRALEKKRTVFFAALMKTRNNQCINGFCDRRSTFSVSFIFTWSTIATCAVVSDFKCVSDYYIWIIDGFGAVCGMRLYHSVGKCIVVYATWTIIMSTTFE